MEFKNREYVTDIVGSQTFSVFRTGQIAPTDDRLFPVLGQLANNFELYKWKYVKFFFRSTCASSTQVAFANMGVVMMNINYDPSEASPTSKTEMLNNQTTASVRVDKDLSISCALDGQMRWVRQGGYGNNTVLKTIVLANNQQQGLTRDLRDESNGRLTIATADNQTVQTVLGQLWVEYHVCLYKPRLYNAIGGGNQSSRFFASGPAAGAGVFQITGLTDDNRRGVIQDDLGVTFAVVGASASNSFSWNVLQGNVYEIEIINFANNSAGGLGSIAYSWPSASAVYISAYPGNAVSGTAPGVTTQPYTVAPNFDSTLGTVANQMWDGSAITGGGATQQITFQTGTNARTFAKMWLKARITGLLVVSTASLTNNTSFVALNITTMDRPSIFTQGFTNSVIADQWKNF